MRHHSTPQVPVDHYETLTYDSKERFASYWHQIEAVLRNGFTSVLEIGPGNGFVTDYLRKSGVHVSTMDIEPGLLPDLVGSVLEIPMESNAVEAVLCSQVLEHLSFEDFSPALREIRRVVRRGAVVSLPDSSHYLKLEASALFRARLRFLLPLPFLPAPRKVRVPREHMWEIGVRGYPVSRITQVMRAAGWEVRRNHRLYDNEFHRFFELGSQDS